MNKRSIAVLLISISSIMTTAMADEVEQTQEQKAISALEFLTGNWSGPGQSIDNEGNVSEYHDTEFVRFDLDRNILLINARGERDGQTVYQLHTVIYFDSKKQHYFYTPYRGVEPRSFACNLVDRQFICFNDDRDFRLTFQRLEDGRWNEFGERLVEGAWVKTFETKLTETVSD